MESIPSEETCDDILVIQSKSNIYAMESRSSEDIWDGICLMSITCDDNEYAIKNITLSTSCNENMRLNVYYVMKTKRVMLLKKMFSRKLLHTSVPFSCSHT